jgi:hypothetical protein
MDHLPEELRDRAFSIREALELDVPAGRLRRVDLGRPHRGVRVRNLQEDSVESRCRMYLPRLGEGQYFSHLTAARLWGLWLPTRWTADEPLHVTVPQPGRAPRIPAVVGHHILPERAASTVLRGLPVATPLESVRTLAPSLGIRALVVLLDCLRRRVDPLATEAQLVHLLAKHGGQRGVRRLRVAFARSRAGVDSPKETTLRLDLRDAGLPEPEVNGVISRPGVTPIRRGDLVFRSLRVVVEYEGGHHQSDRVTYLGDISRFEQLADDWRFVRVAKEHLSDIPAIVRRILLASCQ